MSPRGAQFYLCSGGDERDRTDDPLLAKQVLSQLSYTPIPFRLVLYLLERTSKIKQRLLSPETDLGFMLSEHFSIERR